LELDDALELLHSPWHEERLVALLLMVERHRRGNDAQRRGIHQSHLAHTAYVNNWDLVDSSAEHLVGPHTPPSRLGLLRKLARSGSVWERRIAMLATFHWIRQGECAPALALAQQLVNDPHPLMHKAVGWM